MKKIKDVKKTLKKYFHKYIRLRDLENGCISCGKRFASLCGAWHAGHFFPRSTTYAALAFDEKNTNGQCNHCNTFLEGNKENYRRGLIKRYGEGVIDELEIKNQLSSRQIWTTFEYTVLIDLYKKKSKELEKQL